MTRFVPNSCTSPVNVLNGWPASATSSPMRNTRESRRISSAIASRTASPYVSSRTALSVVAILSSTLRSGQAGAECTASLGGEAHQRRHVHVRPRAQDQSIDTGGGVGLDRGLVRDIEARRRDADLEPAERRRSPRRLLRLAQRGHRL